MQTQWLLPKWSEVLTAYYINNQPPPPPANIFLFSNNVSAIQVVKNPWSKKAHSFVLHFHNALTSFLWYADISLYLVWAPADDYLNRYRLASHITTKATYGDPPNGLDRIQSAAYQKDCVWRLVFQKWERKYYLDRCLKTFNQRWCNISPSTIYAYTITTHPSKNHHPLWKEATKKKGGGGWTWVQDQTPTISPMHDICSTSSCCWSHLHRILCQNILPIRPPWNPPLHMWKCAPITIPHYHLMPPPLSSQS